MANALDYLFWRGDLSFEKDPFGDVDNLLCALISYIDFEGQIPQSTEQTVPLKSAVDAYFEKMRGRDLHLGAIIPPVIFEGAETMAASARFSQICLTAYEDVVKEVDDVQVQWKALTMLLGDGTMYISFSGTDDTLIGWKEDFDMAVCDTIPSQREAAEYVRRVMTAYPCYGVRLGGHSKGGNLAIYAAAKCGRDLQDRIVAVYGNDAPGFSKSFLSEDEYLAIKPRVRLILPDQSFVGLLFYHDAPRTVVKSSERSVRQHDALSWQVAGNRFEEVPAVTGEALLLRKTVEAWMNDMRPEERKAFVEAFYKALTCLEAKTLTDLMEDRAILLRSYRHLEPEQRQIIREMLRRLLSSGKDVYSAAISKGSRQVQQEDRRKKQEKKSAAKKGFVTHLDGASIGIPAAKKKKTPGK